MLTGADLTGANLEGAGLDGANLEGANLDGANLKGAVLLNAIYDGATIWPAGFDVVGQGAVARTWAEELSHLAHQPANGPQAGWAHEPEAQSPAPPGRLAARAGGVRAGAALARAALAEPAGPRTSPRHPRMSLAHRVRVDATRGLADARGVVV